MSLVMIRYRVKRDQVERNLELLRALYDELESTQPDGLRYATFQLDDEVSFVELVVGGGEGRLAALKSFPGYRADFDERCDGPSVITELQQVGSYRFDWS